VVAPDAVVVSAVPPAPVVVLPLPVSPPQPAATIPIPMIASIARIQSSTSLNEEQDCAGIAPGDDVTSV
jgi:hypothetical protein